MRRAADEPGRAARGLRRDSVDARVPLQRVPRAGVSAGASRSRRGARCRRRPSCRSRRCARSRSTTRRRPRSTTRSRCASCPTATYEIGIHIAAPALAIPPRHRRSTPSRASACRPSTCRAASSRCCPTRSSRRSRWRPAPTPPALSLYVEVAHDGAPLRHETRVERVPDRRQPALSTRSARRSPTRCRRRRTRHGPRSCACCGSSRSTSPPQRGKADIARIDYSFDVDWNAGARGPGGDRARGRAARRSTSSSPS